MPPSSWTPSASGCTGNDPVEYPNDDESRNKKLMDIIQQSLPRSTPAERQRFLADRRGNVEAAVDKLRNYLNWRKTHCDQSSIHLDSWTYATQMAIRSSSHRGDGKTNYDMDTLKLPCTLFMQEHTPSPLKSDGSNGTATTRKYLHHFPARIDTKLAHASVYALALAIYIDHAMDRGSEEKVTLVIDVRPGHGWANIKAIHLLPFIQSTVRLLCDLHPVRLEKCVVFPVPILAYALWKAVKPFVGRDTVKKVCLVSGPAGKNDEVPKKLSQYLDEDLIEKFEMRRKSCSSL